MKLTFHGAAKTVTGSKHLISLDNGTQILLDCGMFQGLGARTQALNDNLGFHAPDIHCVLLSHAHIDHSGLIPKLVKEGFTGRIYCTQATLELTEILLFDSAQIQEHNGHDDSHYTVDDVRAALELFEVVSFDEWFKAGSEVSVLYTATGHLAGSAAIHLKIRENGKETTITYSADVGRARHPLLRPPAPFPQAEYIILESTYGDKYHALQASNLDELLSWIERTCLQRQGKLVIPAFSVGRTQEILYLLNQLELEKRLPALHYFVDSPLSLKATETMKHFTGEFNDRLQEILKVDTDPFSFKGLKHVDSADDSILLVQHQEPCVIISASGTADAGRVRHHIRETVSENRHAILFAGYCGPESLGGQLLAGARTVELFGRTFEVGAEIGQLKGLSAHGDSDDLCQFVSCQNPGLVRSMFLVHGEHRAQQGLSDRLSHKGFYPVQIPTLHETFTLNAGAQIAKTNV